MTTPNTITVPMSNRRPVRIRAALWPIIAAADWHSGQHECQANEIARLRVRRRMDGRILVYGVRAAGPGGMPLGYESRAFGELIDDTEEAIRQSVAGIAISLGLPHLADDVFADLPPEDLDVADPVEPDEPPAPTDPVEPSSPPGWESV